MGVFLRFKSFLLCALILLLLPWPNSGKRGSSGRIGGSQSKTGIKPSGTGVGHNTNLGKNTGTGIGSGTGGIGKHGSSGGGSFGRSSYKSLTPNRKAAIAGVLGAGIGAYAGYKLGQHMGSFHHGGHTYWYGDRYYRPTMHKIKCVFEVDENTPNWNVVDPTDKTLIREIVFECNSNEYCCEMSCCRTPTVTTHRRSVWAWWQTLLVILALGVLFAACAFCLIRQVKKRRMQQSDTGPTTYIEESQKPFVSPGYGGDVNQPGYYGNQSGYYPPQPQPYAPVYPSAYGSSYPQAPVSGYPPQHYPPPTYQPVPNY